MKKLIAAVIAGLLACAPATAQNVMTLPNAVALTGGELVPTLQGSGCATRALPCAIVDMTPTQLATYLAASAPTVSIAKGGTGATTLAGAQAALGVSATGSDTTYLYRSNNLSDLASVASAQRNLGLIIGTTVETQSANLDALAALTGTNTIYYRSGANTWSPVVLGPNFAFSGGNLTIPGLPITLSGDVSGSSSSSSGAIAVTLATVPIAKGGTGATTVAGAQAALGVSATGADPTFAKLAGATFTGGIGGTTASFTGAIGASNFSGSSSGTNTGDQTITLTGDVSGSGTGSFAATLATSGVTAGSYGASGTLSVPTFTVDAKGRLTAAGSFALGSAASAATGASGHVLAFLDGSNTYAGAMTFSQPITGSVTGTAGSAAKWTTARTFAFTGDATGSGSVDGSGNSSIALTIGAGVVTNAKAAQMAAMTVKGNNTTSAANQADLTQAQLTAMVNTCTSSLAGAVPSGGSTSTFLRGDCTWVAPANGTVTSVSITTANGVSGSVANAGTTPAITITLGAITPSSITTGAITGTTGMIGNTTSAATTTPATVDLGGTYSSAAGANTKLRIYDDGSSIFGIGVSAGQLDYVTPSTGSHVLWTGSTRAASIGSAGATFAGTITASGASTVSALPTCNAAARGTRTTVTDATMPTFLGTLTGGGSTVAPAFCNGSAWVAG